MGKTALLRRLETRAREAGAIVLSAEASPRRPLTDMLRLGIKEAQQTLAPLSTKLRDAAAAAFAALPEATIALPDNLGSLTLKTKIEKEHDRLVVAFETLNVEIRKHGKWLCLAIDEIQSGDPATLDILIALVHKTAGTDDPILFLGAGLTNAKQHLKDVRTYTERWGYRELGLLSLSETMEAIQEPARANGCTFEPDALVDLARASSGYPYFIQEYASTAWSLHNSASPMISRSTTQRAIAEVRREIDKEFYDDPLSQLSERERRFANALASLGEGEHQIGEIARAMNGNTPSISSIRQQLIRKDIIFAPRPGLVRFRMPLMATYLNDLNRDSPP
jgi:hypothetical protein